jgi:murein L,D-transpeptidase YcbB/YkuD
MIAGPVFVLVSLLVQASTLQPQTTYESPIRAVLEGGSGAEIALWDLNRWRRPLQELYFERSYAPLWFSNGRLTPAGRALIGQLQEAERRGLLVADYDGSQLDELAPGLDFKPELATEILARLDVALSVNAARIASDLHHGRIDPGQVGYVLDIERSDLDFAATVAALAAAADVDTALDDLEPRFRHYKLLKTALARHRSLARRPQLNQLPPLPRRGVRAGETYAGAPALRRLLAILGDLPQSSMGADPESRNLDPGLVAALVRFQARHGLDVDGILGARTFRALTTPVEERVRQIELSLERIRWLPAKLESPPIIVNIPQFKLFAFRTTRDFAEDILQMDVIVGSTFNGRHTPVFAADMRHVVLNPYWDVPRSILVKEMLPAIRADSGWLSRNGYELVSEAGDDASPHPPGAGSVQLLAEGKLRVRQRPGPENELGQMKFIFPNRHNVYMHDTPARELFARSSRAFSHGCIRVSDPIALLAHVLREDRERSGDRLAKALSGSTPVVVQLPRPVRVYIVYGTALATEAGQTLFFDDIYDQDARLAALLEARRSTFLGSRAPQSG